MGKSGKNSRQRRKDAVNSANKMAYSIGTPYNDDINPFDNDRQRRIFEKYYRMTISKKNFLDALEW